MKTKIAIIASVACIVVLGIMLVVVQPWDDRKGTGAFSLSDAAMQQQRMEDERSSEDASRGEAENEGEVPAWDEFVGTEEEYLDAVASAMPRRDKQLNEYEIVYPEEGMPYRKQLVDVVFYRSVGKERAQEMVEEVGLGGRWICDDFNLPTSRSKCMVNLEYPEDADVIAIAEIFEAMPEVASAGVSTVIKGTADSVALDDPYRTNQYYLSLSEFADAWDIAICEGRSTIAVLDTGIDMDHPDLVGNIDYVSAFDGWNNTRIPVPLDTSDTDPGYEDVSHGSMVAGVASAVANNGAGIAGSSYNARIIPIRITDDEIIQDEEGKYIDQGFTWEYFKNAMDWLEVIPARPAVVNMSFSFSNADEEDADLIQESINNLHEQGVVFVASAGNHNSSNTVWPAAFEDVIGVGALSENGTSRWIDAATNQGSACNQYVDICAPGENIPTTQNLALSSTRSTIIENGYWADSGTSLAAPQVAAAAALIKRAHPGYTAEDIEKALFETVVHLADFVDEKDEEGRPNPDGKDDLGRYGYGALDAAAAVLWSDQKNPDPTKPGTGGTWSPTAGGNLAEIFHSERVTS